jgi:hypothetical protein
MFDLPTLIDLGIDEDLDFATSAFVERCPHPGLEELELRTSLEIVPSGHSRPFQLVPCLENTFPSST